MAAASIFARGPKADYDVLVVGSGGAGLSAAIAAAETGARVAVLTKGSLLYSGATASANFSYCAPTGHGGAGDTAACYAADIVASGRGLTDPALADAVAEGALAEAERLEAFGLLWTRREDGRFSIHTFGGHTYPRAIHVGLRTGKAVMTALGKVVRAGNVDLREHVFVTDVARCEAGVCGVAAIDLASGERFALSAPAVVIACGGSLAMYDFQTNPEELTGDGFMLAFEAGAELVDMEFIQAYPTVFIAPAAARGLHYPTGRLLGRGGQLLNGKGDPFFHRHENKPIEHATRDEIARAIALEVEAGGGTAYGGVVVDTTGVEPRRLADVHFESYFKDIGLTLASGIQHVMAAPHFNLGGIRIDTEGKTTVCGLFAAGEVAAGLHGANRLTGTALPEILVMGRRAGIAASAHAASRSRTVLPSPPSAAASPVASRGNTAAADVGVVTDRFRKILQSKASILKTDASLHEAIAEIDRVVRTELPRMRPRRPNAEFDAERLQILQLRSMALSARLHCLAALERVETRGAHIRLDHPDEVPSWRRHIVISKGRDGVVIGHAERACL